MPRRRLRVTGRPPASSRIPRGVRTVPWPDYGEIMSITSRRGWRLLGPAFVAAIAYVDPGNVAANLTAGARFGYLLVWVLVLANLMAVLVQHLSARLGVVTGASLTELLGRRLRPVPRRLFWAQAELIAAATDLAEVIGGAIALHLLFGLPLVWGGLIVGIVSMLLLGIQSRRGQRPFQHVVMGLLLIITIGFTAGLFAAPPDWSATAEGLIPRFEGADSVLLGASMLGATVMPHAIYLHSRLSVDHADAAASEPGPGQAEARRRALLRASRWDVVFALVIAGSVNIAMLLLAAGNLQGVPGTDSIEGAHAAVTAALGPGIGVVFAVGLLVSGLASTAVGCYAGADIMAGLLHLRIPLLARRVITLVPALAILAAGWDPTRALVLSQVALSLGIPFALIPLVRCTADRTLMGEHANPRWMTILAWAATTAIIALNAALVWLTAVGLA